MIYRQELAVAEIGIECLGQWFWRHGMMHEADNFKRSISVRLRDGTTLDFRLCSRWFHSLSPPEQGVTRHVSVWVIPEKPHAGPYYFRRIADKLASFLSFVTDLHLRLKIIRGYSKDVRGLFPRDWPEPVILYHDNAIDESRDITATAPMQYYKKIERLFPQLIMRWFEMYEEWEYALDLYFLNSVEKSNRHEHIRLAVAVMALEALYVAQGNSKRGVKVRVNTLMEPFAERFGTALERDFLAGEIGVIRNKYITHGERGSEIYDRVADVALFVRFAEALFQLHVWHYLRIDIDKILGRYTQLYYLLQSAKKVANSSPQAE